jgi:hypothetical protein
VHSFCVFRIALFILILLTAVASAEDAPAYLKGTLKQDFASQHKSYVLQAGDNGYRINNCGDFQTGQVVDYRVKDNKVYIRHEDGKESRCAIEAQLSGLENRANPESAPPKYQKGTIEGYEVRRDTHIGGGGGGGNGAPASPVTAWTRRAKVYELHGVDLIYKIDYCGAFQAGNFSPGQAVEYRLDGNRVYILHDNNKEYSCQLEGTRKPDNLNPAAASQSGGSTPAAVASAATASTAKLSVASVPGGADIEVDGTFSGNTPSDLEVPEGEHSITVKKPGYKDWERKMKVVAGSSIHLNAEMEKVTNP